VTLKQLPLHMHIQFRKDSGVKQRNSEMVNMHLYGLHDIWMGTEWKG